MKILIGKEKEEALKYLKIASKASSKACCLKTKKRGAIIVKNGKVLGKGANRPADNYICKKCLRDRAKSLKFGEFNTEPCRSIHAEQRAIIDSYQNGYKDLSDSKMYFCQVKEGELQSASGFSCTICSKLILESKIKSFIMILNGEVTEVSAKEMNDKSFELVQKAVNF
ncbi:MAG: deaminase [Patescibacteria group bacterium]|nr:deaminase [Patescibacteria group bacterium]MCL5094201.1 deaminase [Patescibacteria group bacterium]